MMVQLNFALAVMLTSLALPASSIQHLQLNDFLVCKPIGSLFEMQQSSVGGNLTNTRGPAGPPGRRGPPGTMGPTGPPGPTGPASSVDWEGVERRIEAKLQARLKCPGVVFNGSCFWLPLTVGKYKAGKGREDARSLCRFFNATLVDLESEEMYNVLYAYIHKAWNFYIDDAGDYVDIWLASIHENGVVRSSTGGPLYSRWYSGQPSTGEAVGWIVGVKPATASIHTGMWTTYPSQTRTMPFCRSMGSF